MTDLTLFDQLEVMRPINKFHNTTGFKGAELKRRELKAGTQNEGILKFFQRNPGLLYTPEDVWKVMRLPNTPLTSIRRGISDLSNNKMYQKMFGEDAPLEKTQYKRLGSYGEYCFTWKLK